MGNYCFPLRVSAAAPLAEDPHRFAICEQPAHVVAHKSADGDFAGAAHAPASPVAGLEDLQRQLQALRDNPVPLLLAPMLGHAGGGTCSTLHHSIPHYQYEAQHTSNNTRHSIPLAR